MKCKHCKKYVIRSKTCNRCRKRLFAQQKAKNGNKT